MDPNEPVKDINIRDDQDARQRQQIRRAVLEGNIDEALKLTNAYYPSVLEANPRVYFRLRCRKFVEIIRQHAEERVKEQPRAGINPVTKTIPAHDDEDMDVEHDRRGYEGNEWNERMEDDPPALGGFLERALEYGRGLRAEFANSADPEASKHLDEIFALIAYQNPLTEERVAHLLDQSGRVDVAEELNSAILRTFSLAWRTRDLSRRSTDTSQVHAASRPARRLKQCLRIPPFCSRVYVKKAHLSRELLCPSKTYWR